ncbi:MAG: phage minor tail protein L [Syntrophobacteraceae bacterium]
MLSEDQQKLDVGDYIVLYMLDARALGDDVHYFTQNVFSDRIVQWRNINEPPGIVDYTPIDIEATGFEVTGQGTLPTPTFSISNVGMALLGAVITWNGLLGALVYRYRTLKKYLVGEPGQDLTAYWPPDIYEIERKIEQNKFKVSWELKALLDNEGRKIPRRQALRDACEHRYRIWTGGAFSYVNATCPYSDDVLFPKKTITAITKTIPCKVTAANHGFVTGNEVYLDSIVGMTELNGWYGKIHFDTVNTFTLDGVDPTAYGAYASGGTAQRSPSFFDASGVPCVAGNDVCGKKLSDCRLRFRGRMPLPTTAFPGLARVRV